MAASSSAFELKVVEFYAGVGGWHFALKHSNIQARVVAAIDINTTANKVYRHNFPTTTHRPTEEYMRIDQSRSRLVISRLVHSLSTLPSANLLPGKENKEITLI